MTDVEAEVVLDALVAAFPRVVMSPETVQIYARFLVDAKPEHAIAAVAKLIARARGFPSISDVREEIANEAGHGVPDADQAWGEVMRAVSRWGQYKDPQWTHRAVREAVDSLGWREICLSDNAPAMRAHFAKAYEGTKRRAMDPMSRNLVTSITREVMKQIEAKQPTKLLGGKR